MLPVIYFALQSLALLAVAQTTCPPPALSNTTTPSLNLTAIAGRRGNSVLECWQLPGFAASAAAGTVGALNLPLGSLSNATYTVLPARFNGGLHAAPYKQFVVFLSGLAHVTLPNATGEAWIHGGKYGVIIAADVVSESVNGHISTYPSAADTVALQIPFAAGTVPRHTVLHDGPCTESENVGI